MSQSTNHHPRPGIGAMRGHGGAMFERVLFPTDSSACAERTGAMIGRLPNPGAAILVSNQPIVEQQRELEARGWEVTALLLPNSGEHARRIATMARDNRASVIVIGGHRRSMLRDLLLGNPTLDLLRASTTHVLIAPYRDRQTSRLGTPDERLLLERVLCPIDFGPASEEVLEMLPTLDGLGEVILLHVIPPEEQARGPRTALIGAAHRLLGYQARLEKAGIPAAPYIVNGYLGAEILRVAVEEEATLILTSRCGELHSLKSGKVGSVTAELAASTPVPLLVRYPQTRVIPVARELSSAELDAATELWRDYRQQTANPSTDRVFGTFLGGRLVSVARVRRHTDGNEVDAVFTLEDLRTNGYARMAVEALVRACCAEALYMHATIPAYHLYRSLGFESIDERDLPPSIRARFDFALGDLERVNARPMIRRPGALATAPKCTLWTT